MNVRPSVVEEEEDGSQQVALSSEGGQLGRVVGLRRRRRDGGHLSMCQLGMIFPQKVSFFSNNKNFLSHHHHHHHLSQAEALWESKSQIAELACEDTTYKGPVYQTARQNNQSTHKLRTNERSPSRAISSST
jgi:hypothetical protein